ncbi:MAG: tRNA pseudouridine synthase A [Chlamydiia bacterium]|nr:tRNA pseudouridine synthase A [Chlamydiia bacterium]
MFKIRFTITYDGTAYFGWQKQPHQISIQETIENALSKIFNQKISICGAGRTDRGVHAKGQVAMASIPYEVTTTSLQKSLNSLLASDIRILDLEYADDDFHPRYSAKGKIYSYSICTKSLQDPFTRFTTYHHPYPLDINLIKQAIPVFIGTKDFTSFANYVGKNNTAPSSIKTIYEIDLKKTDSGFILTFHGDGFLYKMVRNIAGALISFGERRLTINELKAILQKKDNKHKLLQAPAHGLCLELVLYERSLSLI